MPDSPIVSSEPSAPELPRTGFLTPAAVKRHFAISNSTMYAWVASGVLPPLYRMGPRAMRFRAEDVSRFEQERMALGVKPAAPQQ